MQKSCQPFYGVPLVKCFTLSSSLFLGIHWVYLTFLFRVDNERRKGKKWKIKASICLVCRYAFKDDCFKISSTFSYCGSNGVKIENSFISMYLHISIYLSLSSLNMSVSICLSFFCSTTVQPMNVKANDRQCSI